MKQESKLTSKGQVTIPKDIRDALGLRPGKPVRFEMDERGHVRLLKPDPQAERDREKEEWLARLRDIQQKFKAQDPFPGMDALEYQRWIRESPEV